MKEIYYMIGAILTGRADVFRNSEHEVLSEHFKLSALLL